MFEPGFVPRVGLPSAISAPPFRIVNPANVGFLRLHHSRGLALHPRDHFLKINRDIGGLDALHSFGIAAKSTRMASIDAAIAQSVAHEPEAHECHEDYRPSCPMTVLCD